MAKFEKNIYRNINGIVDEKTVYCVMRSTLSYNLTRPTIVGVYENKWEAVETANNLNVGVKTCTYFIKEGRPSQVGFGPYSPIAANFN